MSVPAFQRLQRVLELEEKQGWRNRAVIGGLRAMAERWQGDALAEGADARQVETLVALLGAYEAIEMERRPDLAETLRRALNNLASSDEVETALESAGTPSLQDEPEQAAHELTETGADMDEDLAPAQERKLPPAEPLVQEEDDAVRTIPPPEPTHIARQRVKRRQKSDGPQRSLADAVTVLPGVGKAAAELLAKLDIECMQDLLWHLPARYDDYSTMRTVDQVQPDEHATIIANLWEVKKRKLSRNREMVIGVLGDATGTMQASWFNKWVEKQLQPGTTLRFSGKVGLYMGKKTFENPAFEDIDDVMVATGRLTPVYPLTEGLTNNRLRTLVRAALDDYLDSVEETLPESLLERYSLPDLSSTIQQIHFPDDHEQLAAAQRRLAFEELLYVQLGVLLRRRALLAERAAPLGEIETGLEQFAKTLPFSLTGAQTRVMAEMGRDLARERPMTRLVQGDVGSGKTAVAAAGMYLAALNGFQAALLAPTQILAEQHFRNLVGMLETTLTKADGTPLRTELLTGRVTGAAREALLADLASGAIDVLVGTTALIQEGVTFADLALVVVDEQHRFGVEQRTLLRNKGRQPHMLVMTATPIPRSLALTIYGDLDLSIIDEMPPGRKVVRTKIFPPQERERLYSFIQREAAAGRQAFIVYTLIDESESLEAGAATTAYARLSTEIMPNLRLALLHGRMSGAEKDEIMRGFAAGEFDVLVSTTVIEVGIDVPNASTIVIEDAERFGLAQLHQLRGRVGRGEHASYCALISRAETDEARLRLEAVVETNDGFRLAEKDLELRGPGEFLGVRQSGLPSLRYARISDFAILAEAREAGEWILGQDPELNNHPTLAEEVQRFWRGEGDIS